MLAVQHSFESSDVIMYRQLILSSILINFISASEQNLSKYGSENSKAMAGGEDRTNTGMNKLSTGNHNQWQQHFWKPKRTPHNITYIEKEENMIRLPSMNKYYQQMKKTKTIKKAPKRIIQKIIKKNRQKLKKLYEIKKAGFTTTMPKVDYEAQEEFSDGKEETTTQQSRPKRPRKYNPKLPRYPMLYHQMQMRKSNNRRYKRDTRDLFILQDFNQLEFLKEKKDYNVIKAHFKKYW